MSPAKAGAQTTQSAVQRISQEADAALHTCSFTPAVLWTSHKTFTITRRSKHSWGILLIMLFMTCNILDVDCYNKEVVNYERIASENQQKINNMKSSIRKKMATKTFAHSRARKL